jgi:Ni2+-binding GTPase involved in maturation of urease and hydrogenase
MITFVTLSGFLGAGKTTTMVRAAQRLEERGHRVVVITNDQGEDLVDTQVASASVSGVGEVTGGCFCCRFEDLAGTTVELVASRDADVVIAEAVGSCTDIQATVIRPLRQFYGDRFTVAPLTTVMDPQRYRGFSRAWDAGEAESDLSYLFRNQLEEADVIALNKIDLLREGEADRLVPAVRERFPHADVVPYAASTGEGLGALVRRWTDGNVTDSGRDLDLDYGRYADAEARLAWLNQRWDVAAGGRAYSPRAWVARTLAELSHACVRGGHVIGHAKLSLRASGGTTKASLVAAGGDVTFDSAVAEAAGEGSAVVNARVDCEPAVLDGAVAAAVAAADEAFGTRSTLREGQSFKPGEPRPTHRILANS